VLRNDARPIGEDSNLRSGERPHAQEPPGDRKVRDGRNLAEQEGEPHAEGREEGSDPSGEPAEV